MKEAESYGKIVKSRRCSNTKKKKKKKKDRDRAILTGQTKLLKSKEIKKDIYSLILFGKPQIEYIQ